MRAPRRRALLEQKSAHLDGAAEAYAGVVALYADREPSLLDAIERERLQDAMTGQAESVFRLERYELAVPLYEAIERRYRKHAASLDALIRLVEIWDRLGEERMAAKVHRQAELRLIQLPESAFEFPESRFDREAWELWLKRRPLRGMQVGLGE